jgi:HNH endonuclease
MYAKYLSRVEYWKEVNFDFDVEVTNQFKLEVSNFGRLRTFHKLSNGNIIKGSMVEGYPIYKGKFYTPREEKLQLKFDRMKNQILKLERKTKTLIKEKASKTVIKESVELLKTVKTKLTKEIKEETKKRTINKAALVHRLVAEHFLAKPKHNQIFVAHLDYNKQNNHVTNLRWMTQEENTIHQQKSKAVIERKQSTNNATNNSKLSVPKVMLIKRMLNENKTSKSLAKQFKVSDMQIHRIKTGENWKNIPAAN